MLDRSSTRYILLLYICDLAVTALSLWTAAALRPLLPFGKELLEPGGTLLPEVYVITLVVWTVILASASAYDAHRLTLAKHEARAVVVGVVQSFLILAGILYLTFRGLSRLLFVTFFALDLALILAVRMGLRLVRKARRPPRPGGRVLLVGVNKAAAAVGQYVADLRWMGLDLVGYVSEDGIKPQPAGSHAAENGAPVVLNAPVLGRLADVPRLVDEAKVSDMVIALPLHAHDELPNLVAQWAQLPVNIMVAPDFFDLALFRSTTELLGGGMPLIGVKEPVLTPSAKMVKRMLDLIVASLALLLTAPIMLVVSIMIKRDSPGPVLFKQQRVGEGGRVFWMYKLRTMVENAAEQQDALMTRDEQGNIIFEKKPDDPRVTRIGRFLRRYSLDEVPQFLNVLKGEMSLVGPRPELPAIVENYQIWQRKRFAVPPGMTGWWQVRGRSQQPMNLRTEDDLYYIQNYSLWLDLRIMWKTVGAVVTGRGAY